MIYWWSRCERERDASLSSFRLGVNGGREGGSMLKTDRYRTYLSYIPHRSYHIVSYHIKSYTHTTDNVCVR